MPRDANGVFSLTPGYLAVTGQKVLASQHNPPLEDIAESMTNSLPRNGAAPMVAPLDMGGFRASNLGAPTSDADAATKAYIDAAIATVTLGITPTGTVLGFRRTTAPTGWLKENGGTIGNGASGATNRANSDTLNLFTLLWAQFDNIALPIQDSAGAASTRGASAAADFAANKRMPLFDSRSRFHRGADDGLNYDLLLTVGVAQADSLKTHNHTAVVTGDTAHLHGVRGVNPGGGGSTGVVSGSFTGNADAVLSGTVPLPTVTNTATGEAETRPRSSVVLYCIKL